MSDTCSTKIQHRHRDRNQSLRGRDETISWSFPVTVRLSLIFHRLCSFLLGPCVNCISVGRNFARVFAKLGEMHRSLSTLTLQNSARCIGGWQCYETVCNWHFRFILSFLTALLPSFLIIHNKVSKRFFFFIITCLLVVIIQVRDSKNILLSIIFVKRKFISAIETFVIF